jgi:alpha-aminoadipate/glutamate carrier protein LysW
MNRTDCPECEATINFESTNETGEIIVCPDCGVDLEIISLDPPAVALAPMEQEDWGE